MCWVLNMSEVSMFVNFRKYDRVLNMCRNANERVLIFQDFQYARFLHMQALDNVLNMPEQG